MKRNLWLFLVLITMFIGCREDNPAFDGFATCLINAQQFESNNVEFEKTKFSNPVSGQTKDQTRVEILGTQGDRIILFFEGLESGSFALTADGINSGYYADQTLNDYQSISGLIFIDKYEKSDGVETISGTFEFVAQGIVTQSVVTVSNGNFSVSKN